MTTTELGRAAETIAATYLEEQGLEIVARNWRNRWCELDIVARGDGVIHFVEVKYRSRVGYGTPAEYITYDKQQRLQRAALAWSQAHGYRGNYQIDVIGVVGKLEAPRLEYLPNAVGY